MADKKCQLTRDRMALIYFWKILKVETCRTYRRCQNHLDSFGYEEIFFAFGKEGDCSVTVLNYAVGKEYAEWNVAADVEGDKYKVRSRFGYKTYGKRGY